MLVLLRIQDNNFILFFQKKTQQANEPEETSEKAGLTDEVAEDRPIHSVIVTVRIK